MSPPPLGCVPIPRAVLPLVFIGLSFSWGTGQIVQAQEQVFYLGIVDGNGRPITDIEAGEVVVQWDGEECELLEFEQFGWPIRVSVFVDNSEGARSAVPHMREGLSAFLAELPDDVEVGLATLAGRPTWVAQSTTDPDVLERGIERIAPDPGAAAYFIDALVEEAERLDDDQDRAYYQVVVMLSGDGLEGSTSHQGLVDEMVERMGVNSAEIHTQLFSEVGARTTALQAQVGQVMADNSRGSFEVLALQSEFVDKLPTLGQDLANKHRLMSNQYRVVCRQPRDRSAQPQIRARITREDLTTILTLDGNVPARLPRP